MENLNTFDSIIEYLRDLAIKRDVITPDIWMRGAMKLNVLLEAEVEKLIELEFKVAQARKKFLDLDNTAVYTKMMIEASLEYREVQLQKAKISNAQETIKLAKKYAQLASDQMRSNL